MPLPSINPSLRAAVERLKHAGSISGVCFGWRRQSLINLTPYQDFRVDHIFDVLYDTKEHFGKANREVDTFWYGFDGVFMLAMIRGDTSVLVLHTRAHEVDFLKQAAYTMLEDCQTMVSTLLGTNENEPPPSPNDDGAHSEDETSRQETNLIQRLH